MSCAFFLLACTTATTVETTLGENFPDCPPGDLPCLDDNHVAACSIRTANVENCLAWIAVLERRARRGAVDAARHMALAYRALADISSDPREARDYRERAIRIYRELIERENDAQSMISLAEETDDEDESIELLKKGLALAPEEYWSTQFLASKLRQRNRPGDVLDAARHMEWAYDQQPGPDRWSHLASLTYGIYEQAGASDRAARFRRKVLRDLGVNELTELPATPDPAGISNVLAKLCDSYLIPAIGIGKCLTSIYTVTSHLTSADRNTMSQQLADAAANAMSEITRAERAPTEMQSFRTQLEILLVRFESSDVQSAYALVAPCDKRLHALERAAKLAPDDGMAAYALGREYANRAMWDKASVELAKAKPLLPESHQSTIDEDIQRVARKAACALCCQR